MAQRFIALLLPLLVALPVAAIPRSPPAERLLRARELREAGNPRRAVERLRQLIRELKTDDEVSIEARAALCEIRRDPTAAGLGWPADAPQRIAGTPPYRLAGDTPSAPGGKNDVLVLEVLVDRDGCLRDPRILRSPWKDEEKRLVDAMMRWVMMPALNEGRPIDAYFTLTLRNHGR